MQRGGQCPPADHQVRRPRPASPRRRRLRGHCLRVQAQPPPPARILRKGTRGSVEPGQHLLHERGAAVPAKHAREDGNRDEFERVPKIPFFKRILEQRSCSTLL